MLLKKNRYSLRGLSHSEKVQKIQKITRVPLNNLNTNIAESDLEEDDISVPICLRVSSDRDESMKNQHSSQFNSKGQVFDQQRINRTIRTMTKELYTLEQEKQKSSILNRHERMISAFSIQELCIDLRTPQDKAHATKQVMENFYSEQKNANFTHEISFIGLTEISLKVQNQQNRSKQHRHKIQRKVQPRQRQTEPITFEEKKQSNKTQSSSLLNRKKRSEQTQSKVSKRFSRSKRVSDQLNEFKIEKKLKFNRSNKKNRVVLNRENNKENIQNIFTTKQGALTERLSFEVMPTSETLQSDFKKRKNIVKNFITFQHQKVMKEVNYQDHRTEQREEIRNEEKNSRKNAILRFQEISNNQLFKKLQQGNIKEVVQDSMAEQFPWKVFTKYRQSIVLLKSIK